jgi:hypothetical protein
MLKQIKFSDFSGVLAAIVGWRFYRTRDSHPQCPTARKSP